MVKNYVQTVPDECDRIVWRGKYYHLPLKEPAIWMRSQGEPAAWVIDTPDAVRHVSHIPFMLNGYVSVPAFLAPQPESNNDRAARERKVYGPIFKAAISLLAACDDRHDSDSPLKYTIPYGALNALRASLQGVDLAPQPAIHDGCVTLQSGRDGVWAHFRVGKGYAFSYNLDADPMGKRFAEEYRSMLAAQEPKSC